MRELEIILEKTNPDHFGNLHSQWYENPGHVSKTHAQIVKPWVETDYEKILEKFLKFKFSDQIRVFDGEKWVKWYRRQIGTKEFYDICQTIEREGKHLISLELVFKTERQYQMITEVKFTEIDGLFISYHAQFPKRDAKLFQWMGGQKPTFERQFVYALWDKRKLDAIKFLYSDE